MAKTYIVTPNYCVRPPPSLMNPSSWPAPAGQEAPAKPAQAPADQPDPASEDTSAKMAAHQPPLAAGSMAPETTVGTLYLGDILRNPLAAELTLINNRKDRLPVPYEKLALPPDVKEGFKGTRSSLLKGRLGIWTALLTSLGLPGGVDVSAGFEMNANDVISADHLETQEMELDAVDDAFLNDAMKVPSVKTYLEGCRDPPPALYMVTGLKIVHNPAVTTSQSNNVEVNMGVNVAGEDVLKIVEFQRDRSAGQEFTGSRPFVLAFRARKILYKRGGWEHTPWHRGASMMGANRDLDVREVQVTGAGGDAAPDENMIKYEEVCVHAEKDEKEDLQWVVPVLV